MRNILVFIIILSLLFTNTFAEESTSFQDPSSASKEKYKIEKILNAKLSNKSWNDLIRNPNDIYKGLRFGPSFEDGKINGYKLYHINKNHIFYFIGARSGDIIVTINENPLNDSEKMIEIYEQLKSIDHFPVIILRKGKYYQYEIEILDL